MATRYFIPYKNFQAPAYSLSIDYSSHKTYIHMLTQDELTNTDELSAAIPVLEQELPNVFTSECFNEEKLPFRIEARSTEIGHLFEHILLEYLCAVKLAVGYSRVEFSGVTRWNWKKEPRGSFLIEISSQYDDRVIFNEALKKTIALMNLIFSESREQSRPFSFSLYSAPVSFGNN